jgi:hypothetical protein
MTPGQITALQSYVVSVVRIMTRQGDHSDNVRLILDSKKRLEKAFGETVPGGYPDLLDLGIQAKSDFPDLL